jgi:ABC-type oligopeptide transport system substrate-binding subunit
VPLPFYYDPSRRLAKRYGVNSSRFFLTPGYTLAGYFLNSRRPLFRNNARLRRAVNFAVNRPALMGGRVGRPTDQFVPPGIPGFRDAHIYPLRRPDVRRARALALGHRRSGRAVMFTADTASERARAQVLVQNLKQIGLEVDVKSFAPQAYFAQLDRPDARFDIAFFDWAPDYIDPSQYTNIFLDGRHHRGRSLARFDSPRYNRLMRRAALHVGQARYRAYADLDLKLSRDAAPFLFIAHPSDATFVSNRVGCLDLRPYPDLAAVCLK